MAGARRERGDAAQKTMWARFLREPTLHFFVLAALVLFSQKLATGEARTIELTPQLKADLLRRYQDQHGRPPTSAEAEEFIALWKTDEALYREALREGIDLDDPTVRTVMIGKMRERVLLQTRIPEPTDADLREYLEQHRSEFETPLIYQHMYVVFPKGPVAAAERERVQPKLAAGATPASLGLRSTGASVNRARIEREFGPEVAEKVIHLPKGEWSELETEDRLLLVKLIQVQGGLPPREELRARLVSAWKGAKQRQAAADATRALVDRYRLEEAPK